MEYRRKQPIKKRGKPKGVPTPVKWNEDRPRQGYVLALLGATNEQMADVLQISIKTFEYWMRHYDEFAQAIHEGKMKADSLAAQGWFKNATGFYYDDTVVVQTKVREYDEDGRLMRDYTKPVKVQVRKYQPPNWAAAQKWLSIRQRETWADIQRAEINTNANLNVIVKQEDLKAFDIEQLKVIERLGLTKFLANELKNGLPN